MILVQLDPHMRCWYVLHRRKSLLPNISLTFHLNSYFVFSLSKEIQYTGTCVKRQLLKIPKIGLKTNYRLMQVKSIAECSHSAILSAFIKLPIATKIFVVVFLSGRFTQI